jgi:hypothetical protein
MVTAGERSPSNEGEINFLAGPTPRSNVAKDIFISLASIPEAHETQMPSASAENSLEVGACNGLVLVRYKDIRQPFWRQSMSKTSEYFMSGGVRGKLMHLQTETAETAPALVEINDASRNFPHPLQGTIGTARDENEMLGEIPVYRTRRDVVEQASEFKLEGIHSHVMRD